MNRNITATILVIIAIGLYFTVTQSIYSDAQAVKDNNDQLSQALDNAQQIITSRETITSQYNSIPQEDRAKLDKMIPSSVDNIRLVIDLNNIALQNHFSLSDVKATVGSGNAAKGGAPGSSAAPMPSSMPSAPVSVMGPASSISEPTLDKVQISFKASASYDQWISFMQALESDLRVMDLTHLTVTANDSGTYDFQAQFQTYWLRQ